MLIDEEPDNYLNFRRTTMCMARDYLKEHFSEPRWISVEERLPDKSNFKDESVRVLVYRAYYDEARVGYYDYHWKEFYTVDDLIMGRVTHWMPLPEPPEVEV
jgi:hypothetical protein